MFTRPPELADDAVVASLAAGWGLDAVELAYEPVGFGAHHWRAASAAGDERFLTVHDLTAHKHDGDTEDDVFYRLVASFEVARALREGGVSAVLAPTPTTDGAIVERLDERFTLAVHPYLNGRTAGAFGSFETPEGLLAALDAVVDVHRHTEVAAAFAATDDLVVPDIEQIPIALDDLRNEWDAGPYGERARGHLETHAANVQHLITGYDRFAEEVRERDDMVITHGEPHAENVFVVDGRSLLIDWDTALVAVPERDLWHLDPGDGSTADAYRERTGVAPSSTALDLYRLWWDLAEVGQYLGVLRRPHTDTTDVAMAWEGLQEYLDPVNRWPQLMG